jgi:hypothetical protein
MSRRWRWWVRSWGLSVQEQEELRRRWRQGESLRLIARRMGKRGPSIRAFVLQTGPSCCASSARPSPSTPAPLPPAGSASGTATAGCTAAPRPRSWVTRGHPRPAGVPCRGAGWTRVRLPGRDYLLFAGSLAAASELGWADPYGFFFPQSPNLFWPHDHAWCVASEIDLFCTLVAGSNELAEALVGDPRIEAWRVQPADPIAFDSDQISRTCGGLSTTPTRLWARLQGQAIKGSAGAKPARRRASLQSPPVPPGPPPQPRRDGRGAHGR